MEPIAQIVAALTAGASAVLGGMASEASKDLYQGLKQAVRRCFGGRPQAEMALEQHESDPETWATPLRSELAKAGAAEDERIAELTSRLLAQLGEAALQGGGKYQVRFSGPVQGAVIGDHAQVVQSFGDPPAAARPARAEPPEV